MLKIRYQIITVNIEIFCYEKTQKPRDTGVEREIVGRECRVAGAEVERIGELIGVRRRIIVSKELSRAGRYRTLPKRPVITKYHRRVTESPELADWTGRGVSLTRAVESAVTTENA